MPGLGTVRNATRSRTTGNSPVDSYPASLRLYLHHWLDFGGLHWSNRSAQDHVAATKLDGDTGPHIVDSAFNTIVLQLWRHSSTVLVPLVTMFTPIAEPKPYSQRRAREDPEGDDEPSLPEAGAKLLSQWLSGPAKEERIAQKRWDPRFHRKIPEQVRNEAIAHDAKPGATPLLPVLEALEYTPLNHLVSWSGTSNNRKHHQNMIEFTSHEVEYFQNHFAHLVKIIPSLSHFLRELHRSITRFPLLDQAPLWTQIQLKKGPIDAILPSEYPQVLIRKSRDARQNEFDQALNSFLDRITSLNCLGIPPSEKVTAPQLHLGMKPAISALRTCATTLVHHLAIINSTDDLRHYPLIEPEWVDAEEDDSSQDTAADGIACTLDDLRDHYKDEEVQAYRADGEQYDEYPDNEEIAEDALDSHFGTLRSAKRQAPTPSPPRVFKRSCTTASSHNMSPRGHQSYEAEEEEYSEGEEL